MALTLFYSWQSDVPNRLNRSFIEDAIKKAIALIDKKLAVNPAIRDKKIEFDKDTRNIPGSPPIAETIFNKISKCAIFIPDITFIATSEKGRLIPNPNVLIEYGWALRSIGYSRIVPIMNSAFGDPSETNLPFDMRHLRFPLSYNVSEDSSDEKKDLEKQRLIIELVSSFTLVLQSGFVGEHDTEIEKYKNQIKPTTKPSLFFNPNDNVLDNSRHIPNFDYRFPNVESLFLRLIPAKQINTIKSNKGALDFIIKGDLYPMNKIKLRQWNGRNKFGAYTASIGDGRISNFTQLFTTGEIWGIDLDCLNKSTLTRREEVSFGFFPSNALEKTFSFTLKNYLSFTQNILKISPPLLFIAGATDVDGYRMSAPSGMSINGLRFAGEIFHNNINFKAEIVSYKIKIDEILMPFFNYVWEECGLVRPKIPIFC